MNGKFENIRARILMKNVCYLGALAALLSIDMAVIEELLKETFADKQKLIAGNLEAIELGYNYAKEHFSCPLPLKLEPMKATQDCIMIDGNTMAGLGCVYAGATVGAWYPITPSTSLMDAFKEFCEETRVDPVTGKNKYCIVQAEDELAAIGIVMGAAWNGARAFTPTSGPGISLMNEFIGFGYYTEIPAVIFDVQRVGPSTGMPTRTQQGDLQLCAYASHGDTRHVLLFPADPAECFQFAVVAFDLAERLQTPVMVLSDLDIGMNDWMVPKVKWDERYTPDRGKVYTKEQLAEMQVFHRYTDVDGDGICFRTLPGVHKKGAYFVRGSGHNRRGAYTEDAAEYQDVLDRLRRKHDSAKPLVPAPIVKVKKGVKTGIVSLGSCDGAVREAMDILAREGTEVNYIRLRGFPFDKQLDEFLEHHERVFVVEQNRDAQLKNMILTETQVDRRKLISILHYSGMPIDSRCIVEGVNRRSHKGEKDLHQKPKTASQVKNESAHIGLERGHCRSAHAGAPACVSTKSQILVGDRDLLIQKPKTLITKLPKNELGLTIRDYEGSMSTLCAGCGHDSITAALVQAFWELNIEPYQGGQDERHRLLLQDHGLSIGRCPWHQRRARPHALRRHRRQCRRAGHVLRGDIGRRGFALHRPGPIRPCAPPKPQHALCHREQRRLWLHQGPVLRLRRRGQQGQEGRGEPAAAHRSRDHRADHGRQLRGPQLLWR